MAKHRAAKQLRTPATKIAGAALTLAVAAGLVAGAAPALADESGSARDLTGMQWHLTEIGAPEAWAVSTGAGVKVAVIDGGFNTTHPDLKGAYTENGAVAYTKELHETKSEKLFDLDGHGTHVSGIIAARADGQGTTGVAPEAKIVPIKILADLPIHLDRFDVEGRMEEVLRTAHREGATVVNMSFGSPVPGADDPNQDPICKGIKAAADLDLVLIASAGNSGYDDNMVSVPAACEGVISVAATSADGNPTFWSTFNNQVDISAPGDGILSTTTTANNDYQYLSGTSMASPIVAGVAALLRAQHPDWNAAQVSERILSTARDTYTPGPDILTGAGIVDAAAAVGLPATKPESRFLDAHPGEDGVRWRSMKAPVSGYTVTVWRGKSVTPAATINLPPTAVLVPDSSLTGVPGDAVIITAHPIDGKDVSTIVFPWGPEDSVTASPIATNLRLVKGPNNLIKVKWENGDGTQIAAVALIEGDTRTFLRISSSEVDKQLLTGALLPAQRNPHKDYTVEVTTLGANTNSRTVSIDIDATLPVEWTTARFGQTFAATGKIARSWLEHSSNGKTVKIKITHKDGTSSTHRIPVRVNTSGIGTITISGHLSDTVAIEGMPKETQLRVANPN